VLTPPSLGASPGGQHLLPQQIHPGGHLQAAKTKFAQVKGDKTTMPTKIIVKIETFFIFPSSFFGAGIMT
jgi:hypothetical protein